MELRPEHITIAVTVFSRREFVSNAIRSALDQSVPVKVIVVEDCGPDPALEGLITREFGNRIEYFRNRENRGLFDNWNACLEYCRTPWLSILHDDDTLRSNFVQTMLTLAAKAPGRALYFGRQSQSEADGTLRPPPPVSWPQDWREVDVVELADYCFFLFPGHLLRVEDARAIGGFRKASYLTGDWDFWFRMSLAFGAAQSAAEVALNRVHEGKDRGSTRVERKGWKWILDNLQRKRNLVHLREKRGVVIPFDRSKLLKSSPISSRMLLRHAHQFSRRILFYNWWLFTHSQASHGTYAIFQWWVRMMGPRSLRACSVLWNRRKPLNTTNR